MRRASRIAIGLVVGWALLLGVFAVTHDRLIQTALAAWLRGTSGHRLAWQRPGEWRWWPTPGGRLERLTVNTSDGLPLLAIDRVEWRLAAVTSWRQAPLFEDMALDGVRIVWRDETAPQTQQPAATPALRDEGFTSNWPTWLVRTLRLRDVQFVPEDASWRLDISEGVVQRAARDAPMTVAAHGQFTYTHDHNAPPWRAALAMRLTLNFPMPTRVTAQLVEFTTTWSGFSSMTQPVPISLTGTLHVDGAARSWQLDEVVLHSGDLQVHGAVTGSWQAADHRWSGYAKLMEWNPRQWLRRHGVAGIVWDTMPDRALTRLQAEAQCGGDHLALHCEPLRVQFDRSQLHGRLSIERAPWLLRLDGAIDQLDLEQYATPTTHGTAFDVTNALAPLSEALSQLAALPVAGDWRIAQLRYRGMVAHQVRIEMKP